MLTFKNYPYSNKKTTLSILFLRKPQKKVFLVARPLRPYPPPLELSGNIFVEIFLELQKKENVSGTDQDHN